MNKYIYLDLDGVVNDCSIYPNGKHGTKWSCVQRLNRIIEATDPLIVVSSQWRYEVLFGHTTLIGFERALMRHGLDIHGRLAGVTGDDDDYRIPRGQLISEWRDKYAIRPYQYVVLDDGA